MSSSTPDILGWSGPATGLFFVAGVFGGIKQAVHPYPRPGVEVSEVQRYFTNDRVAARTSVAGQLASSSALALFTRAASRHLDRATEPSGWSRSIRAAGSLASISLACSATCNLLLTTPLGNR